MNIILIHYVAHMGETKNAYKIFFCKPEGKRPLERPRHRWEDNIKMDLGEIGWESVDWIHLAQNKDPWQALVNMAMNLYVSKKVGSFLTSCAYY
jgi:hypothetical protein